MYVLPFLKQQQWQEQKKDQNKSEENPSQTIVYGITLYFRESFKSVFFCALF